MVSKWAKHTFKFSMISSIRKMSQSQFGFKNISDLNGINLKHKAAKLESKHIQKNRIAYHH